MSAATGYRGGFSWMLLVLAVLLGAGGFLWHHEQKQFQMEMVDQQLLLIADIVVDSLENQTSVNDADTLCRNLLATPDAITAQFAVTLSTPGSESLCATTPEVPFHVNRRLSSFLDNSEHFFVAGTGGDFVRTLVYPLSVPAATPYLLTVSTSLTPAVQRSRLMLWSLLAGSLFLLTLAAYTDRRWRLSRRREMESLAQWIDTIGPNQPLSPFTGADTIAQEQPQLIASCHQLVRRVLHELQQSRQFAADVTHELRTPLTILRGETELALRKTRSPEELQGTLTSNLEEINRMSHLIDDLHLLSKCDLGEIHLRKEPVCLETLLTDLHHQGQILAQNKKIGVELKHHRSQTIIQADELRLRQLLLNLISNAVRYTPPQGTVTLELETNGRQALITVSDTGIGMDHEHLQHIFDRFYRIDKHSRHDDGTGLGLAIVKWIVEAHRGQIEVNSAPEQGSRFVVKLPLSE